MSADQHSGQTPIGQGDPLAHLVEDQPAPQPEGDSVAPTKQVEPEHVEPEQGKVRTSRSGWVVTGVAAAVVLGTLVWVAQDPRLGLDFTSAAPAVSTSSPSATTAQSGEPTASGAPTSSVPTAPPSELLALPGNTTTLPSGKQVSGGSDQQSLLPVASAVALTIYNAPAIDPDNTGSWRESVAGVTTEQGLDALSQRIATGPDYSLALQNLWSVRLKTSCEQTSGGDATVVATCSTTVSTVDADGQPVSDSKLGRWPFRESTPVVDRLSLVKQDGAWKFDGFVS